LYTSNRWRWRRRIRFRHEDCSQRHRNWTNFNWFLKHRWHRRN